MTPDRGRRIIAIEKVELPAGRRLADHKSKGAPEWERCITRCRRLNLLAIVTGLAVYRRRDYTAGTAYVVPRLLAEDLGGRQEKYAKRSREELVEAGWLTDTKMRMKGSPVWCFTIPECLCVGCQML